MPSAEESSPIDYLDVSTSTYADRLSAATLQGLVNRTGPRVFLDYGIYDDPNARRTNEIFLDDAHWYGEYRELLGNQDQHNFAYYQEAHHFHSQTIPSLDVLIDKYRKEVKGCIMWDADVADTANVCSWVWVGVKMLRTVGWGLCLGQ